MFLKKRKFEIVSVYFCGWNLGPPGAGQSWILGSLFEQIWLRTTRQCYIPDFKHLSQVVLKKKIFEYFSMYFYGLNLGPLASGHLRPWDLHLNKLCRGPLGYATYQISNINFKDTEFQASKPSDSEEEKF